MGKTTYPLRLSNAEYDKVLAIVRQRGMTVAEWLRRTIREQISRDIK